MNWLLDFHFLRPAWLLLLPLSLLLVWGLSRHHSQGSVWREVVDAHLLPWLTTAMAGGRYRRALWLLAVSWIVAIMALAGPVWEKLPQPVFRADAVRLLVLDLSRSMDARDIRPSRLTRARHKVLDMLDSMKEGQVGLIVFAGQPHVVSPLTDDAHTIAAMVPVLNTGIMPAQGSNLLAAMQQAKTLLAQSGVARADIILITDGLDNLFAVDFAKRLHEDGYRVSVLAVGTAEGAPIPSPKGGFVKDSDGGIVVATLSPALRDVAKAGGGVYTDLAVDDSDIKRLLTLSAPENLRQESKDEDNRNSDIWRDMGVWLLPPLLLAAALSFRRGWLIVVVLAVNLAPVHEARADSWRDLWQNGNQRGLQAFTDEQYDEAVHAFSDPRWQAASRYRQQEYEQALQLLQSPRGADDYYNRGNILAHLGRVTDAIAAYEKALDLRPDHQDAAWNKKLLDQFVRRAREKNQQNQPGQGKPQQGEQQGDKDGRNQQAGEGPAQPGDGQQQSGQSGQQSDSRAQDASRGDGQGQERDNGAAADAGDSAQQQDSKQAQQQEGEQSAAAQLRPGDGRDSEQEQAIEQWLGRIPDDPGGLLQRKFQRQYERRGGAASDSGDKW